MFFIIFMVIGSLIMPVLMIVFGRMLKKNPPKKINRLYGYRSTRSSKNMDTWKFAQEYCGGIWVKFGIVLMPLSLVVLLFMDRSYNFISVIVILIYFVQIAVLFISVFLTERALKKKFGD